MGAYLDVVFSIVIGSLVLLMIFSFNLDMVGKSNINNLYAAVQKNGFDMQEILRNDLKKIGLGVPADTAKFIIADSTRLKFKTDYNLDGVVNEIYYYLGSSSSANFTVNPNDRLLYRKVDNNTPETYTIGIINFRFTYYNNSGNQTSDLNAIRQIEYNYYIESVVDYNGEYPGIYIQGKITPKNLE